MLIPLKLKYRCSKPSSGGKKGSSNSTPKKKTIWAALEAQARRGKKK